MNYANLTAAIRERRSYLCVGLDSDLEKIPQHLHTEEDPVFAFNRAIIDATAPYCVAYKLNTAFYEAQGEAGWRSLERTLAHIPKSHFSIADAKRGDIGNTVDQYARAFFQTYDFDAITVAPYMGEDSVSPFLKYDNKWVILLALTSNPSAGQLQQLALAEGSKLYEQVLRSAQQWANKSQMMFVIGATQSQHLRHIRQIVPEHFLLVPGVGAQGGSLEEVSQAGLNEAGGLLVNSSRGVIYASTAEDFAEAASQAAQKLQQEMDTYLSQKGL